MIPFGVVEQLIRCDAASQKGSKQNEETWYRSAPVGVAADITALRSQSVGTLDHGSSTLVNNDDRLGVVGRGAARAGRGDRVA